MAERTCSVDGCDRPFLARGWCGKHYQRWRNTGTLDDPPEHADRYFWSKVDKNGPVPDFAPHLGQCWLWTSTINTGYGQFSGKAAHRFAWIATNGPIPEGLDLDHLCRVRHCVRPTHLEPVTRGENIRRVPRAPLTHCVNGHEYTVENTIYQQGGRVCRICKYAANDRYLAKRRAKESA